MRTLDEWARELHTSSASIRRAFRAETGMPFSQWRTMFRLNASLRYLQDGMPVSVVANRVGFESSNGYAMAVRRHFSCRPTEFARTSRCLEFGRPRDEVVGRHQIQQEALKHEALQQRLRRRSPVVQCIPDARDLLPD